MLGVLPADAPLISAYAYLPIPRSETPAAALIAAIGRAVREAGPGRKRRRFARLRVRVDERLFARRVLGRRDIAGFRTELEAIERDEDPYAGADRAHGLHGYYAPNDDSCQPFDVSLPHRYDPGAARRYPLVLFLHHHGWTDWYRPFQGSAPELTDAVVVAPHGRGSCDYLWIAEDDALAVLHYALAEFHVDPARVYVTGWSMGGTGSFHLPGRYPDRFAASFPVAGNADFTAWEQAWKEDRRRIATPRLEARMALRWATAPVTFAENFLHVAISIDHGALDAINPVGHSRSMAGRLRQLGYSNVVFRAGQGGHGWGATLEQRVRWMSRFRIDLNPKRVRFKTAGYRHDTAYWLTIERIGRRMELAEVDIEVAARDRIRATRIANVERFRLRLAGLELARDRPVRVQLAGEPEPIELPVPLPQAVVLEKSPGGAWRVSPPAGEAKRHWPPPKRKGLEGPIEDAFRDPFMVVIGTAASDPFARWVVRSEAERWLRQWRRRFQVVPPVKDDREVTAADIRTKNLILFGGPAQNRVVARIGARLPVRIEGDQVVAGDRRYAGKGLGIKLVYPNPENPGRTVVLLAATDWRGMWQLSHRFGTWFDWMPLDNRPWFDFCVFDDKSRGFETFLDVGFFDEDWSLAGAVRYRAVKAWRARTPPRNYPPLRAIPARARTVRLSDLWPDQIDTAREPLRFNRSLHGKPLAIGHAPQAFGLGQWIESAISFNILGRFKRFRTKFGIDAEGQKQISSARRAVEFTRFKVLGDGRVLAEKSGVRFDYGSQSFDVDVTGVRRLTLMVLREYPQGWLYGPICWGEPVLER